MYAKNTWEKYKDQLNEVFDYNEGYKHYISKNKTVRSTIPWATIHAMPTKPMVGGYRCGR